MQHSNFEKCNHPLKYKIHSLLSVLLFVKLVFLIHDNYNLQVGAFSKYDGALITKNRFKMMLGSEYDVIIKKGFSNDKSINRVWISGFRSEEEIKDFKEKNSLDSAMIIAE